ncbi:MAG: flagellar biosynthetic protein FliR [Pseudomonadota bacterium]
MEPELLEPLVRPIQSYAAFQVLGAFALLTTRFAIIVTFMPMFAEFRLPISIRYAAALALAAPLLPTLDLPDVAYSMLAWDWFLLILKEMVIGLFLLVVLSLPFWAVEFAGSIIELQRGLGNEAVTDPNDLFQSQPTGRLFFLLFLLFILTSGGFVIFLDLVYQSFVVFPVLSTPDLQSLGERLINQRVFETMFEYGLLILMPALLLLLLADIAIALMSRFAQQLNVLQLVLVLKGLIVILALPFYGPGLLMLVDPLVEDVIVRFNGLAQ